MRERLEKLEKLRPVGGAFQVGVMLIYAELFLPGIMRRQVGYPAGDIVYNTALALIACGLAGLMGVWHEIGFRRPESWRALLWFSPLLLTIVDPLHGRIYAGVWQTLPFALLYLVESIQRRVIFDGLMVRSLLPAGRWTAAIVPAMLQGILIGVEFSLVPPEEGFIQLLLLIAASTAAGAFAYAALRICTGLLWPLIVVDVAGGITYYMTLPPHPSPYPLTSLRLAYFVASIAFGLLVGGVALVSAGRVQARERSIADGRPVEHGGVAPQVALQVALQSQVVALGDHQPSRAKRWAVSCLGIFLGAALLACSFVGYATVRTGAPPAYQAGSQHPYFAARPGTSCDGGTAHWSDDDPEERYTCRPDGLQITQLKFDYEGEAYFSFAGDDESSVPFKAHHYWVQVDTLIVGGGQGTCVDLHVHVQDFQGRQWFSACNDGTWDIGRCDLHCESDVDLLSGALRQKTNRFTLAVDVTDTAMTFFVNGAQVALLHDNTYTSTDQLVLALDGSENASSPPSAVFSNFRYTPLL